MRAVYVPAPSSRLNLSIDAIRNRWGILAVGTAMLFLFLTVLGKPWQGPIAMGLLLPSFLCTIFVERAQSLRFLVRATGGEQAARIWALALCSTFACVGAFIICLRGGADGAEFGAIVANAGSALMCLWFRGSDRESTSVVAPYTGTFFLIIAVSVVRGEFSAIAVPVVGAFAVTFMVLGAARCFAAEQRKLAEDRLTLINNLSEAELENRMAAERLELALQIADAGVYEIRPLEQRVINGEALTPIYGRTLAWDDFRRPEDLVAEEHIDEVRKRFSEAFRSPMTFRIEYKIKTADGGTRWVRCTGKSFSESGAVVDRLLIMLVNISNRKGIEADFKLVFQRAANSLKAQRALIASLEGELYNEAPSAETSDPEYNELDEGAGLADMSHKLAGIIKEIEERDGSLVQAVQALREARCAADAANAAKSEFLANMSHELRTPLNAVLNYAEIIMEDLEAIGATESMNDLQRVHGAAKHLLHLINGVLDLSKVEAGHFEMDMNECDPAALARDVVDIVRPVAHKKMLALHFEAQSVPLLTTDVTKFRQCLLNLLSNACKFTATGSVTVRLEPWTAGGDEGVAIHVIDTGIGVDQNHAERIFEPFIQADTSITRAFGGTGLGLAITRRFARLLGGDVTLKGEPGGGSHFILTLASQSAARSLAGADAA